MEYKGTKGGFKLHGDKYFTIQAKEYIKTIATINCVFMPIEESKANAILMVKSYEMLIVLINTQNRLEELMSHPKWILGEFGSIWKEYSEIKNIIKEATEI